MTTITIPKELTKKGELVAISRKEYEEFLTLKKILPMFKPTSSELRAINRGRKSIRESRYIEWRKLKYELANLSSRSRRKAN